MWLHVRRYRMWELLLDIGRLLCSHIQLRLDSSIWTTTSYASIRSLYGYCTDVACTRSYRHMLLPNLSIPSAINDKKVKSACALRMTIFSRVAIEGEEKSRCILYSYMIKTQIGTRYEGRMLGSYQPRVLPSWRQSEIYDLAMCCRPDANISFMSILLLHCVRFANVLALVLHDGIM